MPKDKPKSSLERKDVEVDVLKLIRRYGMENGVQLDRGQQSLMDLGNVEDVNWDPVMVVLIAHFFEGLEDEDIQRMPVEQQLAVEKLKAVAKAVTTGEAKRHFVQTCEAQAQGKSHVFQVDPSGIDADPDTLNPVLAKNENMKKAFKIIRDAQADNRPLAQDELARTFALMGTGIKLTPEMWQHSTDRMVKHGDIAIDDQKALMADIVRVKNLQEVEPALAQKVKCMGTATGQAGALTLKHDPMLTKEPKNFAKEFNTKFHGKHSGYFPKLKEKQRAQFVERPKRNNPLQGGPGMRRF